MLLTREKTTELARSDVFRESCPELEQYFSQYERYLLEQRRRRGNRDCAACKRMPYAIHRRIVTLVEKSAKIQGDIKDFYQVNEFELVIRSPRRTKQVTV